MNINVWPKHISHGEARGRHAAGAIPRPVSIWGTFGSSDGRMGPVVLPARWNEGRPSRSLDTCPPAAARAAAMIAAMQARAAMAQGSVPQRRGKKPQRTVSSPRALSARLASSRSSKQGAQSADPLALPLTEEELDVYAYAAELLVDHSPNNPSLSHEQAAVQFAATAAAGATVGSEEPQPARRVVRPSFLMA